MVVEAFGVDVDIEELVSVPKLVEVMLVLHVTLVATVAETVTVLEETAPKDTSQTTAKIVSKLTMR